MVPIGRTRVCGWGWAIQRIAVRLGIYKIANSRGEFESFSNTALYETSNGL